ncbi:hypothetical protein Sgly_2700 [Syntrophobotulus glycolicus DSM 8271]|uniref:DUF2325 domain-containing protein n=1 Tax=Syntrophobotulus glycolicus (strain DSM 8271 / FlGlyR) TaxID=645991 RepID=F0SXB3_SYNGF|nr:DUF2325 domain-containing protein [Syntrophobotulus glycolicus]ADY56973.1 hypothetical protein Sgly_2700 [Syntrophobotulus glycolicus DSM 8271]
MSIVVIGGHDGMHKEYKEIIGRRGHQAKVYTQMPPRFEKAIGKPDGVILFTGTVSHKMIVTAVKEAKKNNIKIIRSHSCSTSSLEGLIQQMETTFSSKPSTM